MGKPTSQTEILRSHLVALSSAYCSATGKSTATIGEKATGDWKFFDRIKTGGFNVEKYDEALRWFGDNWPAGENWPLGVQRPAKLKKSA